MLQLVHTNKYIEKSYYYTISSIGTLSSFNEFASFQSSLVLST